MYPRKFYNDAPDGGGGTDAAAVLAKAGMFRNPGEPAVNRPQVPNTEIKEQVTTEAPKTETVTAEAQPATQETPKPPVAEPVKVPSWQEVLKQQQPDAVLKELGFDDKAVRFFGESKSIDEKMIGFLNHWKTKGDVKPYLEAITTDYEKMSPEEVMRHNLRREFPEMQDDQFKRLYNIKVIDKYKLDPDKYSEEDIENGKIELFADAKPVRQVLIKGQQDFLLPIAGEPQPDPRIAQIEATQAQAAKDFETYKSQLLNDNYTKNLLSTKTLTVGEGEDKFNYILPDPQQALNILFDKDAWAQALTKEIVLPDGTKDRDHDVEKQILVSAFISDPQGFLREYAKHLKAVGAGSVTEPMENAKQPHGSPAVDNSATETGVQAMAKRGRFVNPNS
jgi:hypothetical protein